MEGTEGIVNSSEATTDYSAAVEEAPETDVMVVEDPDEVEEAKATKARAKEAKEKEDEPESEKPAPKDKKAPPAKAKPADDDLTLTIDGKKFKARDYAHLKQLAQKAVGSEKRFLEANETKKFALQLVELAKRDPARFLKEAGQDPDRFAYDRMNEKIQYEEMDETQRKIFEYERQVKQFQKEREQWQQQQRQQQEQQQQNQIAQELDSKLLEAFKKSGLPKHKFYVQQIAATLLGAAKRGEDLSVEEATAKVKERTFSDIRSIASQMDAKAIRRLIGEDAVKKLMDAEVKRVTAQAAPTVKSAGRPGPTTVPAEKPKRALSPREWDAHMEKLRTRG